MQAERTWFDRLTEQLGKRPNEAGDWKWVLAFCVVAWAVAFGLRLFDLSLWGHPGLSVNGEYILSTHDAYLWLAAADGVRGVYLTLMPEFTNFVRTVTGMSLDQIAFWMPAVLSGLVGVACVLWGWLLGGRWAGLAAGLIGANAPGFFYRSRLGYYDTDLFILVFPLLAVWALAWLLSGRIRSSWLLSREEHTELGDYGLRIYLIAFGLGLLSRTANWWHLHITELNKLLFWVAVGLALVLARRESRGKVLQLLAVFGMAAFAGVGLYDFVFMVPGVPQARFFLLHGFGVPTALVLAIGLWALGRQGQSTRCSLWVGLGALTVMTLTTCQFMSVADLFSQVFVYFKPAVEAVHSVASGPGPADPPSWPGITQSVIEAKAVDWGKVLQRLGPTPWLSVVGVFGFGLVVALRPVAVLLLPLLALGLAGGILGIRFTMFAGPAVALGLGVPLFWAVRFLPEKLRERKWSEPVVQIMAGLLFLVPLVVDYSDLRITPVIDRPHAEALLELGKKAEQGGRIWTWWDFGYAAQYYAGRMTVNDGGRHAGRYIYPEALALTTDSFRQSTQVIKYSALHDYDPAAKWNTMSAVQVKALLERMRVEEIVEGEVPAQYVVVPWQCMKLMGWMTYYGNWDVETKQGVHHKGLRLDTFQFDPRGYVLLGPGKSVPVSSVDMLDGGDYKHRNFIHIGPHLVFNKVRQEAYLLDDEAYESVLVQLLVGKPGTGLVGKYFELVVEGTPHVRIYRVK